MKKIFLALFLAALFFVQAAFAEDSGSTPTATPTPSLSPQEYTYATATSNALGLTILYPSHWENLPGRYTVCFREPVEDGDIPARFAITYKELSKKPDEDALESQLYAYLTAILIDHYDSYECSTLLTDLQFLGKTGVGCIYKGFKGEQVVRGYVVISAVGTTAYAYHFSCDENDYSSMESVMTHIMNGAKTS